MRPRRDASRTSARISAFGRIRSWPRVYGTTQKLQSIVATFDDGDPGSNRIATAGQPEGKGDVVVSAKVELRATAGGGLFDEHR